MKEIFRNSIHYISTKFPSIFLKYLRNQLKTSELKNSSLYEIAKVAHSATTLDELYLSIHSNINNLMYAKNMFIAIHDVDNDVINFPYYVDKYDNFQGTSEPFSDKSLTCNCIHEGIPVLLTKRELMEFSNATLDNNTIVPKGTISEYWLGCPLIIDKNKIGAIVVQSYDKNYPLTIEDSDLLNFVSELVAMVIQRKYLEAEQKEYQSNLESKIRDRTKELFYAKEKAESAAQAKSEFLANMSHELRTPLNAILGFCEILIEDANDTKQIGFVGDLEKIHKSGTDLLALINDILDLSRIEVRKVDLNISKFNINDLIDSVQTTLEPYARINNNEILIKSVEENIIINSDELKIRQILFNVLTNACKNSENNKVILSISKKNKDGNKFITFEIEDFGIGIDNYKLKTIFEPFQQGAITENNKLKGTGLGLSITKRYCELLGGGISVESIKNQGTVFTVEVRQDYNKALKNEEVGQSKSDKLSHDFPTKGKILIIDDDINFLDLIDRKLSKSGYLIFTASNGYMGLEKAKKLLPDIIILDIIMPDIDGWTVYQNIKKIPLLSQIPIIITTIGDYEKMAEDFGVSDFISKPIVWKKLNSTLDKYKIESPSKHILVIDDDPSTRTILRKMLIKDGWRVDEAENGKIALDRIKKDKPELILLDLMMPVMDGFSFLNHTKNDKIHNNIPIIIITSKDLTSEDYKFLNNKVDLVIQKGNYNKNEILETIESCIRDNKLQNN